MTQYIVSVLEAETATTGDIEYHFGPYSKGIAGAIVDILKAHDIPAEAIALRNAGRVYEYTGRALAIRIAAISNYELEWKL